MDPNKFLFHRIEFHVPRHRLICRSGRTMYRGRVEQCIEAGPIAIGL
jgi:hypothetical protein